MDYPTFWTAPAYYLFWVKIFALLDYLSLRNSSKEIEK